MQVIQQYHEIIEMPENALEIIEKVARTCYKSEDRIQPGSAEKLVKKLKDLGHGAMLEFKDVIVKCYTNRGVSHELVRQRIASYAQESTRYVNYKNKDIQFIKPVWIEEDILGTYPDSSGYFMDFELPTKIWLNSCYTSAEDYRALLNEGWRPEEARDVLNNALKTGINIKTNLREWTHIFELRCSKKAHPQMRALMLPLLKDFHASIPVIFDDLYQKYIINGIEGY